VTDGILDQEFLIVDEYHFDPVLHRRPPSVIGLFPS
jgi:hypothetical protein